MIDFEPNRLGHCCYLNEAQIKEVCDKKIPVEICPTSNVAATQCQLVSFLKHIHLFNKYNCNSVICCDDTLLFSTNISMELFEYFKAIKVFDNETIKQTMIQSVDAIFLDDDQFKE